MRPIEPWTDPLADPTFLRRERFVGWFEAAWNAGGRPRVEDYLPDGSEDRAAVLVELVHVDREFRHRAGEAAPVEEYLARFPELADVPGALASLRAEAAWPAAPGGETVPRILGRFEVLEEVGRGAFGVVHRGRDTELDRTVAIKFPRPGVIGSGPDSDSIRARDRFVREARSAARLRHPGIVTVHEVGTSGRIVYLVSEFIQGTTLAARLAAGSVTPAEAVELIRQVAEAIDHAHQNGVIHRDLKPTNILIDQAGRPHVADFGLAKHDTADGTLTLEGEVLGTPAYMAPEQARGDGRRVDGRCDIYSLGVILYQLLTGELPFRGTAAMVLDQVLRDEPRPPRRLNDRVPHDLETICLKAMAKEPDRRYATAGALVEDLTRLREGRPIRARPVGWAERLWIAARRRPAMAALVMAVALTSALGFAGVLWQWRRAEAARQSLELNLYARVIALAEGELAANDTGRAAALLEDCPEGRRGWEWHHLARRAHGYPPLVITLGSAGFGVAFTPDGRRLATATRSGAIELREDPAGAARTLNGHDGPAHGLAFHPDGRRLVSSGADGSLRVWDSDAGRMILKIPAHDGGAWDAEFSPDGRRIASAGADGTVKLWDATSGAAIRSLAGHRDRVWDVAFSPDGRRLASASRDGTVRLWEPDTGRTVRTLVSRSGFPVQALAFHPDGRRLAAGGSGGIVTVWDLRTGTAALELETGKDSIFGLTFSPDGRRLATPGDRYSVKIWDAESGQELLSLRGHTDSVWGLQFSPDGRRLASASSDGTQRTWEAGMDDGPAVVTLRGHRRAVHHVAYSPDGRRLASASADGTLLIWDDRTGRSLATCRGHSGAVLAVAFSPDGRRIASGGQDPIVRLWDAATGAQLASLKGHATTVAALAFRPVGDQLASAGYDGTARVWDVVTGAPRLRLGGHEGFVYSLAYSPDGRLLASGDGEGTLRLWDANSGRLLDSFHASARVRTIAFSPDGRRVAAGCWDDGVHLWDLATHQRVLDFAGGTGRITSLAYCRDGRRIITAGWDQAVRLWDAATGRALGVLFGGHADHITSIAYRPDGQRLASSSFDRTIRLWDLPD
jgi:WD40 repeat protein